VITAGTVNIDLVAHDEYLIVTEQNAHIETDNGFGAPAPKGTLNCGDVMNYPSHAPCGLPAYTRDIVPTAGQVPVFQVLLWEQRLGP
jgi:hypothetical protein